MEKVGRIIIRCDASHNIGSGHIIRCRTVARYLKTKGNEVIFICRNQPGNLIDLLSKEFYVLQLKKKSLIDCSNLSGSKLYRGWLGCSEVDDANETVAAIKQAKISDIDWVIVDHYSLDETWQEWVSSNISLNFKPKILVIDDLANRRHHANLIIDQNYFGEITQQRYDQLVAASCVKLLGPKYCILGPEYAHLHELVPPRSNVRRILIYFGGIDNYGLNLRVINILEETIPDFIEIDIVLGVQSNNIEIRNKLKNISNRVIVHEPLNSLAGLIARADLCIGAGGTTTWERACLGLPSIVIPLSENQIEFNQALNENKYISVINYDNESFKEQLLDKLNQIISNPLLMKESSIRCAHLVDGNGMERIENKMKSI